MNKCNQFRFSDKSLPEKVIGKRGEVALRIGGRTFSSSAESTRSTQDREGNSIVAAVVEVPRRYVAGFRLTDIPDDINLVVIDYGDGDGFTSSAMFTRCDCCGDRIAWMQSISFRDQWDESINASDYARAMTEAVSARSAELDDILPGRLDDEGDLIAVDYTIKLPEEIGAADAVRLVEEVEMDIERRRDALLNRS